MYHSGSVDTSVPQVTHRCKYEIGINLSITTVLAIYYADLLRSLILLTATTADKLL